MLALTNCVDEITYTFTLHYIYIIIHQVIVHTMYEYVSY